MFTATTYVSLHFSNNSVYSGLDPCWAFFLSPLLFPLFSLMLFSPLSHGVCGIQAGVAVCMPQLSSGEEVSVGGWALKWMRAEDPWGLLVQVEGGQVGTPLQSPDSECQSRAHVVHDKTPRSNSPPCHPEGLPCLPVTGDSVWVLSLVSYWINTVCWVTSWHVL